MEKAKVGLGRKLLALFVLLALATLLLPNATSAYADDDDVTVVGTYTVVANLSVPASYIPLGMTAYLTNANNPIDGTGTPTTPTEEATATLTEYSDGSYTLVVQVVNQVFTLQTMGSTSTYATAEVTGTSSDLVFASGVSFDGAPETRISEVTFTISEYVEDGYVFEGCGLYATALNYTISDAPVTLTFELPDDEEEEEEETHTHSYVESSWTWSDDYSTANVTLVCTDNDDTQVVEAEVTSTTSAGMITYTATATYNDVTYTNTQSVEIDSSTVLAQWEIGDPTDSDVIAVLYGDGSLVISGTGDTDDYAKASAVPWYSDYASVITSVTFEDGVTPDNLDYYFYGCTSLTTMPSLPDSVTSLKYTFRSCTSLTSVSALPSGVTSCYGTFYKCTSLTSLPDDFEIPSSTTTVATMFYGCTSLASLPDGFTIHDTVTTCAQMFYNCSSLASLPDSLTIPSTLPNVAQMFMGCTSLSSLPDGFTIPSTVTTSYSQIFANCPSLTQLPEGFRIESEASLGSKNAFNFSSTSYGYDADNLLTTYCYASDYEALSTFAWSNCYRVLVCLHDYEAEWTWSDDYSTATLTLTCTGCGDEQTPDVTVSVETVETSCTVDGSSTYTATATYDDTEYSDVQTVEGDSATGHSYAASTWTWADEGSSATLTFACANCGDEVSYDATMTSVVTTEATETEDGVLTCTAVVEVDGVEYSDTATLAIAATGSDDDADDDADADTDADADADVDDDADDDADTDDDADADDADTDDDADAADADADEDAAADADDDALAQTGDNVAGAAGAAVCAALAAVALGGAALRRCAGEREEI